MSNRIIEKYKNLPIPAKATLWFIACNFFLKGISFFTSPIFTRLLPTDEYGKLSVFLSYEQLFMILSTWEIHIGAYQKGLFKYSNDVEFFTSSSLSLMNLITITLFLIVIVFNKTISTVTELPISSLVTMFFYLLLFPAYSCWIVKKRKTYEYKAAIVITILYSFVVVLIPILALLIFNRTATIKINAQLIAASCFSLFFYIPSIRSIFKSYSKEKLKTYWIFCIRFEGPLVFHSLSFLILSQADRIMIGKMIGNTQAAYYSVSYALASVVIILMNSMNQTLTPWRYQKIENQEFSLISKVTTKLLIILGGMILVFIMIAPEIMKILYPKDYFEGIWCIPPISASIFFMFMYTVFVNVEEYFEETKYVVIVSTICGIINIVLNYFGIFLFGYIACAYTTLISYILFAIGHYFFMQRILHKASVKNEVVCLKCIVCISVVFLLLVLTNSIFYNLIYVRYSLLIILVILAFIFKKRLLDAFSLLR